jgi:hypothetical protein
MMDAESKCGRKLWSDATLSESRNASKVEQKAVRAATAEKHTPPVNTGAPVVNS